MENNNQEGQINIELDEKVAEGTYSNLAIINHSNTEFVLDFILLKEKFIKLDNGDVSENLYKILKFN